MKSSLKKIGNSAGVIIPKPFLDEIGLQPGDKLDMVMEGGRLFIQKPKPHPREGWEEDSIRIGKLGLTEEEREWLDAPLSEEADAEWEWDGEW